MSARGTIFNTMVRFFREDDWNFRELEGRAILSMGFSGENGAWTCRALADESSSGMRFYSVLDSRVPSGKRQAIAEFITRANYGLKIGNFEMDFSDGEVRYKTSISVQGGRLTTEMVKHLVYLNVLMMDRYFAGIMSVVYGGATPAAAITKIEG